MIYDNILDALGHTPLIRLGRMTDEDSAEVLVKFEGLNVGGSIKTRTAYAMICKAEEQGLLQPDSVIVEPTSGNQGIGLALVGAVRGYRVRIIMPDSVSEERRKLIEHYGAEVVLVHDDGNIGECINECVNIAERMQKEDPKVYVPQQFENPANVEIQRLTGEEILKDAGRKIDGFCSGIGTGGTITSGGSVGTHLQMGIGDGLIPGILDQDIYDEICIVKDEQAIKTSKQLASLEGIMCGISSGTNVCAALRLAKKLGPGKTVVTVLPDTAERYFSTPLFREVKYW